MTWYVRRHRADLWHRADSPHHGAALCGWPSLLVGWPDAQYERPARLVCTWCDRVAHKALLKGAP